MTLFAEEFARWNYNKKRQLYPLTSRLSFRAHRSYNSIGLVKHTTIPLLRVLVRSLLSVMKSHGWLIHGNRLVIGVHSLREVDVGGRFSDDM